MTEIPLPPKSKPVAIFGAGGHGTTIGSILLMMDERVVFLDDDIRADAQVKAMGSTVVGGSEKLTDANFLRQHDLIVALGDNRLRKELSERAMKNFGELAIFVDRSAVILSASLDTGCMLLPGAVVSHGAKLGRGVNVGINAVVAHHCVVENYVSINDGAHLGGNVTVREGAFIGLNATVLPGIHIGPWATIGAGAVVTKDVPLGSTVVGNPARIINSDSSPMVSEIGDHVASAGTLAYRRPNHK